VLILRIRVFEVRLENDLFGNDHFRRVDWKDPRANDCHPHHQVLEKGLGVQMGLVQIIPALPIRRSMAYGFLRENPKRRIRCSSSVSLWIVNNRGMSFLLFTPKDPLQYHRESKNMQRMPASKSSANFMFFTSTTHLTSRSETQEGISSTATNRSPIWPSGLSLTSQP